MAAEVKVKKAGTEEEEFLPFTREERDQIIAAFKANCYYSRYGLLVEFLCRPSEALALRWKQITAPSRLSRLLSTTVRVWFLKSSLSP